MFDVNTDYEPNTEPGQVVQYCRCADAHVQVIAKFERDMTLIPFTAYLKRHIGAPILESAPGELTE